MMHGAAGLAALEARLRHDLEMLELPAKPWVPRRQAEGRPVADVAVIGAGMCGLAVAAALRLVGMDNIRVLDRAPAGREGPWVTWARMETLRSPKHLAGPALGLPSLTFRAWFEAQHGAAGWERLGKIPRGQWMDYLVWYRRVMGVPVENGVTVARVVPRADGPLALETEGAGTILARRVVLATGRDGLGGPHVPALAERIDRRFWAHSAEPIDFAALRGRRVGVVGAGASAMDNAATALEAGAARLDMFVRRPALPRVNKSMGLAHAGAVLGVAALGDAWKWRFQHHIVAAQTPPPRDSTQRVAGHPQAWLHLGCPVTGLSVEDGALRVGTPRGHHLLDFLIFATGFRADLALRPELAEVAPHVRFWADRFVPEPGQENEELATSPDLGPDFAFREKVPGACPALARIHAFTYPATLSHGKLSGDIPAVSAGAQRLAVALAQHFFAEEPEHHFAQLQAFATPELLGDEWPAERVDGPPDG